jgi:ribosomal protein L11 methyltransferase
MPYRVDIASPSADASDQLIELGALDVELLGDSIAAILPDALTLDRVAAALRVASVVASPAIARDSGSVWLLRPRPVRIGTILIAPAGMEAPSGALRLTDSSAFGTGHHPTTALCIEALEEAVNLAPASVLDVGTGSGVLALSALMMGVPHATCVDIDADALKAAAEHARLNDLADRLELVPGGPEAVRGAWPLVVANVLAGPLIEMAHVLVRRVTSRGRLILSGIQRSLEAEVRQAYQRLGMRHMRSEMRAGWTVVVLQASW